MYTEACTQFDMEQDSELTDRILKVLKKGRVALVERALMDAIKFATTGGTPKLKTAKDAVNMQIRGFGMAKIAAVADLHQCLWVNAQRIIKNQIIA